MKRFTMLVISKRWIPYLCIVGVWGVISLFYERVILPSPLETIYALAGMIQTITFWQALWISFSRLLIGFSLAFIVGALLGGVMGLYDTIYELFRPIMLVVQSIPPISWILLAILWFGIDGGAQILVLFLALLPIFFFYTVQAIQQVPEELVEMATVYKVGVLKKWRNIYYPSMKSSWQSAFIITSGMGWKTIVMAEVISGQTGIGAAINTSRIYIQTTEVLAWTIVIATLGIFIEWIIRKWSKGGTKIVS